MLSTLSVQDIVVLATSLCISCKAKLQSNNEKIGTLHYVVQAYKGRPTQQGLTRLITTTSFAANRHHIYLRLGIVSNGTVERHHSGNWG